MTASINPILNNPYQEPKLHYATDLAGALNYEDVRPGRRIFVPEQQTIPTRQRQASVFEVNDWEHQYGTHLINLLRKEVGLWRKEGYPASSVTRVTKTLLAFWFNNPDRLVTRNLFFAQREAIETAIWLNEVAPKSNAGQNILNLLKAQQQVSNEKEQNLPRIAFKMATGSGKTVVMATLILYHFLNRQEYRQDTRFADYFLVVAPGVTIRDRLNVLNVDTYHRDPQKIQDYYRQRSLVPPAFEQALPALNARLVITNYHGFEQRTLQGNKKTPFDGKRNAAGNKTEALEDFNLVIRRVLGDFKTGSRLMILNDEAHHCYLPKEKGKTGDEDANAAANSAEENARAAVWFRGLVEITRRFKVGQVYDLSATPYYLSGSGWPAYSLFPWVVSDFGLIEAIESGLVKIPFLPESDNTHQLEMPVLRNLYEHVKDELPRKGIRKKKTDARAEGVAIGIEGAPKLPDKVKLALDQFYDHYQKLYDNEGDGQLGLNTIPPVLIVVCNNTSVSKEMYKYIAGYEQTDSNGKPERVVMGHYDLFNNYDTVTRQPLRKPPTLLIDSSALENANQINDDFKKVFGPEIDALKREYRALYRDRSADQLTDADILREVVNTVGRPGKLGAHIRCVVSVSMLTEGWDANTVTHVMGLRAFGSQLLCEQVAGRALRRRNYLLAPYEEKTGDQLPQNTRRTKDVIWKFPPEYAHIIGVPFRIFKSGTTTIVEPPEYTHVQALPERQQAYEITFPNVDGYRVETPEGELQADFTGVANYELPCHEYPLETVMSSAFMPDTDKLQVRSVLEYRDQELVYKITQAMQRRYFANEDGTPQFHRFQQLKRIVEKWYETKILVKGSLDPNYKKLICFRDPANVCEHIYQGIVARQAGERRVLPILNYYNKFGSTKYVHGNTSKEVYKTTHSHVNYSIPK